MTTEKKSSAFKDWFDRQAARRLGAQVAAVHRSFDAAAFVRRATRGLDDKEMAERVGAFADALRDGLPDDTPKALRILQNSLPPERTDTEAVTDGWLQWPVGELIKRYGVEHFDASMEAMVALTKRFSSEFAVRPFLEHEPERTFAALLALTTDPNPHVRRWCSEGTRPRLPWGKRLDALVRDPSPIWPILEALKDDDELYVRRSVANNLNDIAKDHPELVVKRAKAWSRGASEGRRWVVRHGLRSLIKAGHPGALSVVGFEAPAGVVAELAVTPKRIAVGESVQLTATIEVAKPMDLVVDYVVHYVRTKGRTGEKVFKWKVVRGGPSPLILTKNHPMKTTTIRALYAGVHRVQLQINGARVAEASFRLREAG